LEALTHAIEAVLIFSPLLLRGHDDIDRDGARVPLGPPRAFAQGVPPDRDVYMVIDLSTGKMWGFPTLVQAPYPQDATSTQPPTSEPFLLGTFDLGAIQKKQ
jgi:hypothetical protein